MNPHPTARLRRLDGRTTIVDMASGRSIDRLVAARLPQGVCRLEITGRHHDATAYLVLFALRGSIMLDGRPELSLEAGELAVISLADAVNATVSVAGEVLRLTLPAESIGPHQNAFRAAGRRPIQTREGTASLVAHMLRGLADAATPSGQALPGRLAQHVVGLLALACGEAQSGVPEAGRPRILQNAKEFIESHLGDIGLSPDTLASACNVSTRTLHRMFETEGFTISGWIRARRLEQCRIDLSDQTHAAQPVSAIGTKWGLWDAAHFSRAFKLAYGKSPSAFRASMLAQAGPAQNSA